MARKGIWASPTEFKAFGAVDKTRSLASEIATRDRSIDFYALGMYLPNPDPILKKLGQDIRTYRDVLSDAFVRGCVTSLKSGVKSLLWEIDRGKAKSRQARFVADCVKALDVKRIIGEAIDAYLYGYEVSEVMWSTGQSWTPDDVKGKPPEWFVFDQENVLKFRTRMNWNGEDIPDRKFLLTRYEPTYQNPYGFPTLSCCFWPSTFRKGGFKFWVTFAEKFGMPFIVGKHPRAIDPKEVDDLANKLDDMVQDAVAAIPDDSSVEIMGQNIRGEATIYNTLIEACKTEISIALLGHTAGAISTPGKLGGDDPATEIRQDVIDDIKGIVEYKFNTLIEWIAYFNFSERVELPRFYLYAEEDVDLDQATRDKTLADAGVQLTPQYYMREYGFEEGDIASVGPKPQPSPFGGSGAGQPGTPQLPANFSKPERMTIRNLLRRILNFAKSETADQKAIDDASGNMDPAELQAQAEGVLKPVIDLVKSGKSYEDIMTSLTKAYPKMDSTALEEMLGRAIFVAECLGRMKAGNA